MLCSYFMSKLYLKLTCFCSFVFCFYIENLILFCFFCFFFKNGTWIIIFCLPCDPAPSPPSAPPLLATVAVYLVVKSFLLVSSRAIKFLCGLLEKCTKKRQKKKKETTKKRKTALSAPTLVCQFNELRVR